MGEETWCGVHRSWGELCFLRQWKPYLSVSCCGPWVPRISFYFMTEPDCHFCVEPLSGSSRELASPGLDPVVHQSRYVGSTRFGVTESEKHL